MRKNLLQGMFVILAMLTFTISTQAKCYIVGNDGIWHTNHGVELPETDVEGVYEGEVEFTSTINWYGVADALMDGESDWEDFNANHRYSPIKDSTPTPFNTSVSMYKGGMGASFKLEAKGSFRVRVDFNNMEITVLKDRAKAFYILGSQNKWLIDTPEGKLTPTEKDGVYSGTVEFTNKAFVLTPACDSWDDVQKYILATEGELRPNFVRGIAIGNVYSENNQVEELGTYDITFDENSMTILLRKTGDPTPLYMINGQTGWSYAKGIEFKPTDKDGIYKLEKADFNYDDDNHFALTTALTDDADLIGAYLYGNATALSPNRTKHFDLSSGTFLNFKRGIYDVTVDMNEKTIYLYEEGYVPKYPEEIYFNGTDRTWATDKASATLSVGTVDGVYAGNVNFAYPYFSIATALTAEPDQWEEYNKNRLGGASTQEPIDFNAFSPFIASDYAFYLGEKTGTFFVKVDLRSNKMLIVTDEPLADGDLPTEVYTIGNDNVWEPYNPSTIISQVENGVYQGTVEIEPQYGSIGLFIILPRLSKNWDIANASRIGIRGQNEGGSVLLESGYTYPIVMGGQYDLAIASGKYKMTLDLINNTLRLDDEATGVKGIKDNMEQTSESLPCYDLSGRKIGKKPAKGLYIQNGKKVIVK